jgi:F0F1-type ATP synthase delta subunit
VSIAKRTYAETPAQPTGENAAELQSKFKAFRDMLNQREQKSQEVIKKIGAPLDSSKAAAEAHNWYWLAYSENKLSQVEQDLTKIEDYIHSDADWAGFIARGSIPPSVVPIEGGNAPAGAKVIKGEDKQLAVLPSHKGLGDLLQDLFTNAKISDVSVRALESFEDAQLQDLPNVIELFRRKHEQAAGPASKQLDAHITVAAPATQAELNGILAEFLEHNPEFKGTNVNIITKVDPSIVGGFKLKIADRFVDLSERKEFDAAVAEQELQTSTFYQKQDEAALWQPYVYWKGPYANDAEYLEAMEDKYGDDVIEAVRGLSGAQFETEVKAGANSKLIADALAFSQPAAELKKKMEGFVYFKPADLPNPSLDELVNDFQKVRSLPTSTPRLGL